MLLPFSDLFFFESTLQQIFRKQHVLALCLQPPAKPLALGWWWGCNVLLRGITKSSFPKLSFFLYFFTGKVERVEVKEELSLFLYCQMKTQMTENKIAPLVEVSGPAPPAAPGTLLLLPISQQLVRSPCWRRALLISSHA